MLERADHSMAKQVPFFRGDSRRPESGSGWLALVRSILSPVASTAYMVNRLWTISGGKEKCFIFLVLFSSRMLVKFFSPANAMIYNPILSISCPNDHDVFSTWYFVYF